MTQHGQVLSVSRLPSRFTGRRGGNARRKGRSNPHAFAVRGRGVAGATVLSATPTSGVRIINSPWSPWRAWYDASVLFWITLLRATLGVIEAEPRRQCGARNPRVWLGSDINKRNDEIGLTEAQCGVFPTVARPKLKFP